MSTKLVKVDQSNIIIDAIAIDKKIELVENDLTIIQDNLLNTEKKLSKHLDTIISFSEQAQHPKVYESIAKIADSISKLNRDAAEILKQKNQLYKNSEQTNNIINNTYNDSKTVTNFSGSSSDLLDTLLKDKGK